MKIAISSVKHLFVILTFISLIFLNNPVNAATSTVVISPGLSPNPVSLNTLALQNFTASLSGHYADGSELQIVPGSEIWTWAIAPTTDHPDKKVLYSSSSTSTVGDPPANSYTAGVPSTDTGTSGPNSSATLAMSFLISGYYQIPVEAAVNFTFVNPSGGPPLSGHASGLFTTTIATGTAGDFYPFANPNSLNLHTGSSNTITIQIHPQNNYAGTVDLACTNLPTDTLYPTTIARTGMGAVFSSSSLTFNGSVGEQDQSVTLTLNAGQDMIPSIYNITVRTTDHQFPSLSYGVPIAVAVFNTIVYITGPYDSSFHKTDQGVREANRRDTATGAIATDAVLSLLVEPVFYPWRASPKLNAHPYSTDAVAPTVYVYNWTAAWGTFDSPASDTTNYNVNKPFPADPNQPFGTTAAIVQITIGGHPDQIVSSNPYGSYSINWHQKYENWVRDASITPVPMYKALNPTSTNGFPYTGTGSSPTATWPVYDVDIKGLTDAGVFIAAATIGLYDGNPIYAGLVALMPVELEQLNQEVTAAATTTLTVNPSDIFIHSFHRDDYPNITNFTTFVAQDGVTDASPWLLFRNDDGTPIDKYTPTADLLDVASQYTMLSVQKEVPYLDTFYKCDEYDVNGYKGSHSADFFIFNTQLGQSKVFDIGRFQLNTHAPFHL